MTLTLATVASGVARTAHYVIPTGLTTPIQTLLLEPQRTNRLLQSQTLDAAAWVATNVTVTANNANAPDGTATADTLDATSAGGSLVQAVSFTGSTGTRAFSVFLKAGTAAATDLEVYDVTAAASLRVVRVTWTGGVPAVTSVSGAGTIHTNVTLANGWYRIRFNADSVVAGVGRNEVRIFPGGTSGTGTVIAWGVAAEEPSVGGASAFPTQYIETVGTVVTRNRDALWFPFTAPPQAMTVYVRAINAGAYAESQTTCIVYIGDAAGGLSQANSMVLFKSTATRRIITRVQDASVQRDANVDVTNVVEMGDLVEHRGVWTAARTVLVGVSVNGGAEQTGGPSAATGAIAAWAQPQLMIGTPTGSSIQYGLAYTHVVIAAGEQSMATMRTLAGVA